MSLYNYVGTPNNNLICCICRAPFTDPTTTRTCAHTFCYECIHSALSHSALCPVDRSPLAVADLAPANPIVRSLVDELEVECVHRQEGCEYTCERQSLAVHLEDECAFGETACPSCGDVLKRGQIGRHVEDVHGEEEEQTEEIEKESDKEIDPCPHAALGCPYQGPLDPTDHLPTCPYESLKHFFTANTAKVSLLTEHNMILRHRVDALEGIIHSLRKDTSAAKNALGPWFRSSYNHTAGGGVVGGMGTMTMASTELPGPSLAEHEDFFATERRALVAPLDLGSTLEGTLVGLRESVVGLATGIDSVGRRNEIALTNETLRLGEEMMSVRAQMHGLRMQMHGMMMDRNAHALRDEPRMMGPSITKL